jgi:imidazolonepropionase
MKVLIKNIKELIQVEETPCMRLTAQEMNELSTLKNAWLAIEDGIIVDFGEMKEMPGIADWSNLEVIDAEDCMVFPAWCDSHTHLVFAASRESEFVDRIHGLTYQEIAEKGGGILNSAQKLASMSEDELYENALQRLNKVVKMGTGAIEIKSGYGLSLAAELKILRVIKRLKENCEVEIKSTFLGAHAIPSEYKNNRQAYIDLIINEMLPQIQQENLADYIDVFCETNYFTTDETIKIIQKGISCGLTPKIHVNQFTSIGGIQAAVNNKALSVDHLEVMKETDFESLKNSSTIPTLLPSCSFFIGIPYAPAKKLLEQNISFALATDFNPGSTPSGNMNFVLSLACIQMKLTPEQAINAATINGAYAMGLSETHGSICRGKTANLFITKKISSYAYIPYSFGENCIDKMMIKGKWFDSSI